MLNPVIAIAEGRCVRASTSGAGRTEPGNNVMPEYSITTDVVSAQSDLKAEMPAFAAAGFAAIHWCQHWAGAPVFYDRDFIDCVAAGLTANHLRIADVHGYSGTSDGLRYTDELFLAANLNRIEFAGRVGAGVLVLHLPLRQFSIERHAIEHSISMIESLLPSCSAFGVLPALENLDQSVAFHQAMLAAFTKNQLGFCYDSGHALIHKQVNLVRRFSGRLAATHLHDNDGVTDQHLPPGEGKVDWPLVADALRAGGYDGTWNLEVKLRTRPRMPLEDFCRLAYKKVAAL